MRRMRRRTAVIRVAGLVMATSLLVVGCGGSAAGTASPGAASSAAPTAAVDRASPIAESTPAGPSAAPAGDTAGTTVEIAGFAFSPAGLSVPVGSTVTWTNRDGAPHTVTADDGSFDSRRLSTEAMFSQAFPAAGMFPFHCAIHPGMKGTVAVTP